MEKRAIIIGGGWSGLLSGIKLLKNGDFKITIMEQDDENNRGGLLRSKIINGFTFDVGGPHLIFSRNSEVLNSLVGIMGSNCVKLHRNNYVYYKEQFIEYPFENGIYRLDVNERIKFGTEMIKLNASRDHLNNWVPKTMIEWIEGMFGQHMGQEYLIPYNEKIWKRDLNKMAADWVFTPGRIPVPAVEDVVKMVAGLPTVGYKEQEYFFYPKVGGIQSLYESLKNETIANGAQYIFDQRVKKIEQDQNGYYVINGMHKANKIVSTMPLPELLEAIASDNEYQGLIDQLDYNSVIIVGFAISKPTPNQTSVYIPDKDIIFHRYTWMSALIPPDNPDYSNLIVEITTPEHELGDVNGIKIRVINDLLKMGIIEDENQILLSRVWFNKYGYPIYTLNHNEVRNQVFKILENEGIESIGRWGSWHYWNTDMIYKKVFDIP